mmetsp:Transcript_55235/g.175699  ORF Transcript_55235/g.175699 Transcript_55235/m.175699 type:complete len:296 (-) Transcript_55235:91-978(-)
MWHHHHVLLPAMLVALCYFTPALCGWREADGPPPPVLYAVYRLIGNDIPTLHSIGQHRKNVKYILEHEPELPGAVKRFYINRVVNGTEENALLALLAAHGYTEQGGGVVIDRIDVNALRGVKTKADVLLQVTNQNVARNAILDHGFARGARWVFPLDGNQFVTKQSWRGMVRLAEQGDAHDQRQHVANIPMFRMLQPQSPGTLRGDTQISALVEGGVVDLAESQIGLAARTGVRFNTGAQYGLRNKLQVLMDHCEKWGPVRPPRDMNKRDLTSQRSGARAPGLRNARNQSQHVQP